MGSSLVTSQTWSSLPTPTIERSADWRAQEFAKEKKKVKMTMTPMDAIMDRKELWVHYD
jgi:hypothetical protein